MTMLSKILEDTECLTNCPGCGSESITNLQPPDEHYIFLTSADEMLVETGVTGCEQCGLIFLNPRMGQGRLFEYYGKQSRLPREGIDPESPFSALMDLQIDLILRHKALAKGMRVLEIGCAEGFFLKRVDEHVGGGLDLYGVELSEKYLEQAKKLLPDAIIYETPLEQTEFSGVKFDLVVLRHVLEHLANPADCLNAIRSILAPEGIVYIEVPDSGHTSPAVSRYYHHEHLLYFTPETLSSYLVSSGIEPTICDRYEDNPIGSGFSYPVIRAIGKWGDPEPLEYHPGYAKAVFSENKRREEEYMRALLEPVRQRLEVWASKQKSVALFGAGPHTMDLLQLLEAQNINWKTIFDNNPMKHGKHMRGIPIVKPDERTLRSIDCILVSSAEFEAEMVAQVRATAGLDVEVMPIYADHVTH